MAGREAVPAIKRIERLMCQSGACPPAPGEGNSCPPTDVLVISTLVCILKPPPTAHVINKDAREIAASLLNVGNHLAERIAALNVQAALALVGVDFDDVHRAPLGILLDHIHLVVGGVLLVLGRHSHVGGCSKILLRLIHYWKIRGKVGGQTRGMVWNM